MSNDEYSSGPNLIKEIIEAMKYKTRLYYHKVSVLAIKWILIEHLFGFNELYGCGHPFVINLAN